LLFDKLFNYIGLITFLKIDIYHDFTINYLDQHIFS